MCVCVCFMVFYFPVSETAETIKLALPFTYCHSLFQPWHDRSTEVAEGTSFNNRLQSYPITRIFRPTALLGQVHKHKRTCKLTTHRLARPIFRLKEV
jgi:hypothetical protein